MLIFPVDFMLQICFDAARADSSFVRSVMICRSFSGLRARAIGVDIVCPQGVCCFLEQLGLKLLIRERLYI